jgi:hypothetical protein
MLNADLVPDVTGRQLGYTNKRWDANLRNVNITGTLTGTGIGIGAVTNASADTDSLNIESDTGNGQMRPRLRLGNELNADYVPFEQTWVTPRFGSNDDAKGGSIVSEYFSSLANSGKDYLDFYQRGQVENGNLAARLTTDGELINYGNGYAAFSFRSFNGADANPLFGIKPTGEMVFGPGGATAVDSGLKRLGPQDLGITDGGAGYGDFTARSLILMMPNGTPAMVLASATLIPNLNADLLDGADWSAPPVIGSVAPNDANFDTLSATTLALGVPDGTTPITTASQTPVANLTVNRTKDLYMDGVINNDSPAFKSKRVSTGSIASGARASIAVNFTTSFPSANYTVSARIFDALNPGTAGMQVERIVAQQVDHVTVQVINNGAEARTGTIHLLAFREA